MSNQSVFYSNFRIGIYVDHEATTGEEEERECYVEDKSQGNWAELPDLVIERIFSYLNNEKRYYSSLVCRRWYQAFHLPYVWSTFVLEDRYFIIIIKLDTRPTYFNNFFFSVFYPEGVSTTIWAGSIL